MDVAISTVAWDGHGMAAALDGAAEAGFRLVEPAFIAGSVPFEEADLEGAPARALAGAIAERGLAARAVSAHLDLSGEGALARLRRRIGLAGTLGARVLITNAGPAANEAAIRATLEAALPVAEDAGVVIALENPGHGAGDLIPDAAAGAALLDRIGAGPERLGLNLDLGNVLTYSGGHCDPAGEVAAAGRHLVHLHLKDVADQGGDWLFVPLGEGDLDATAALTAGVPMSLEMPLRLRRPGRADPIRAEAPLPLAEIAAAVRRAAAFVTPPPG